MPRKERGPRERPGENPILWPDARSRRPVANSNISIYAVEREWTKPENWLVHPDDQTLPDWSKGCVLEAAKTNDKSSLEDMRRDRCDMDEVDPEGNTALHIAVKNASFEAVDFLLKCNADVLTRNHAGFGPIHTAVLNNNSDMVRALVGRGADINQKTLKGYQPIHLAVDHILPDMVHTIITQGGKINALNLDGRTPLELACKTENPSLLVDMLIKQGGDVNIINDQGQTLIHVAADKNLREMMHLCIVKGLDVCKRDGNGDTALHIATRRGYKDLVAMLINSGAKFASKDANGNRALHIACDYGHDELVFYYVQSGARLNARNNDGWTPFLLVCRFMNPRLFNYLIKQGADISTPTNDGLMATHLCAANDDVAGLRMCFTRAKIRMDAQDDNGWTVLHHAAHNSASRVCAYMLRKGADDKILDYQGRSCFDLAIKPSTQAALKAGIAAKFQKLRAHLQEQERAMWAAQDERDEQLGEQRDRAANKPKEQEDLFAEDEEDLPVPDTYEELLAQEAAREEKRRLAAEAAAKYVGPDSESDTEDVAASVKKARQDQIDREARAAAGAANRGMQMADREEMLRHKYKMQAADYLRQLREEELDAAEKKLEKGGPPDTLAAPTETKAKVNKFIRLKADAKRAVTENKVWQGGVAVVAGAKSLRVWIKEAADRARGIEVAPKVAAPKKKVRLSELVHDDNSGSEADDEEEQPTEAEDKENKDKRRGSVHSNASAGHGQQHAGSVTSADGARPKSVGSVDTDRVETPQRRRRSVTEFKGVQMSAAQQKIEAQKAKSSHMVGQARVTSVGGKKKEATAAPSSQKSDGGSSFFSAFSWPGTSSSKSSTAAGKTEKNVKFDDRRAKENRKKART